MKWVIAITNSVQTRGFQTQQWYPITHLQYVLTEIKTHYCCHYYYYYYYY